MNQFPSLFEPMLLSEIKEPFDSKDYLFEIKFDGIRALIFVSPTQFAIYSRHKVEITHQFPELKEIQKLVKRPTIFDGEITSFVDGKPNFSKLQERVHLKSREKIRKQSEENPVVFMAFDLLFEGDDLTQYPLIKRKRRLSIYPDTSYFVKTFFVDTYGKKLFQKVKEIDLEGIVAKQKKSLYEKNKRTDTWLKIKNKKRDSFLIGGYLEKENTPFVSLLLGEVRKNDFYYVGKVSVAKKYKIYQKIKKQKQRKTTPFVNYEETDAIYLTPKLSCVIEYLEVSSNGKIRHPVFLMD